MDTSEYSENESVQFEDEYLKKCEHAAMEEFETLENEYKKLAQNILDVTKLKSLVEEIISASEDNYALSVGLKWCHEVELICAIFGIIIIICIFFAIGVLFLYWFCPDLFINIDNIGSSTFDAIGRTRKI